VFKILLVKLNFYRLLFGFEAGRLDGPW